MHRLSRAAAASVFLLAACAPALNWRESRLADTGLSALLPCKPDHGERQVPLAGRGVPMKMAGCEAGGALFALASATLADPAQAGEVLAGWQKATAANIKAQAPTQTPFVPPGAAPGPQSLMVAATGQRPDGGKVESRAAYFLKGSQVYQAVIYADRIQAEAAETFFSSLKIQ